ncbi:MAG: hypothetical protein PVJ27_08890, partial [Candidatus Brocadiaceae bacterium]
RRDDADYFVKEVQPHERDVLLAMIPLRLSHVPRVAFPALLRGSILVTDFITGGPIQSKMLEPGLVRDFATVQNRLRSRAPTPSDRRFFREGFLRCSEGGRDRLRRLRAEQQWLVLEGYAEIAARLARDTEQFACEFASMPFARQHHDFREENILAGPPQVICDWGSSYGHGPFLYDLAPFCLRHPENLAAYAEHSKICRQADAPQVRRWVHVGAVAGFWSVLHYLDEFSSGSDTERFLDYQYETYRRLGANGG